MVAPHIHITTSGAVRNPIGSEVSPNIWISNLGGVHCASIAQDGQPFDPDIMGEEEPILAHLEAYIQKHSLTGSTWKLSITTPLWDATWERNTEGKWLCVKAGLGYA